MVPRESASARERYDKESQAQLNLVAKARPYLEKIDRNKDISALEPKAKREAFQFYFMILNGWHLDRSSAAELFRLLHLLRRG